MKVLPRVRDIRTVSALLTRAEQESLAAGLLDPGAEHLVLASLELPAGTARTAFAALGHTADGLRAALADNAADALAAVGVIGAPPMATSGPGPDSPAPHGPYRSKGSLQDLLTATRHVANGRHEPLMSAHVLMAAADLADGTLARALTRLGVDPAALSAAAQASAQAGVEPGSR